MVFFACNSYGQMRICSYKSYMTETELKKACNNFGYSSNLEAEKVIDDILGNIGLYRNFIIKECPNISNAVAASVLSSSGYLERYIIYDKQFLTRVKNTTNTDWGAISILAHEIGHHLNGHNLVSGITNYDAELQADEFSGFVLAKMGASLDESLRAINSFGSEENSETHPKKSNRIGAISRGWNKSNKNSFNIDNPDNIVLFDRNQSQIDMYVKMAIKEGEMKNYNLAGDYILKAFQYSGGTNIENLYYACSYYVNANNYDKALKYYLMLIKNGIETLDSNRQQEIYRNIGLIYSNQGKVNDAIKFLDVVIRENPNDISAMVTRADLSLKINDIESYKRLIRECLTINPNDSDMLFNLGVITSKTDAAGAEAYYKKAIEIKPDYFNAYLNLAILKLDGEKEIIDEMNKLGTSQKDNKRYEVLKKERVAVFREALPYLEKANELDSDNKDVSRTLLNVYGALEMTDKKNALKAKM